MYARYSHTSAASAPLAAGTDLAGLAIGAATAATASPGGKAAPRTPKLAHAYDYDVVVIGGGSGGLALVREAAALGAKAALFDFVPPSPQGTKWGLGGTCVNVGCIPKKLMHNAALLGAGIEDARAYGWGLPAKQDVRHDWEAMTANIHGYIKGTNWGYRTALRDERVEYMNALARVAGPHAVEYTDRKKGRQTLTAAHIVVAVGGRPRYPDNVPGAQEHGITSDDLFWLPEAPGKTLLVGGGYVALECAGVLHELGYDTSVMVRGPALRGFDQDMAERVSVGGRSALCSAPARVCYVLQVCE
jgi:thioredoxin reductase (NADPH)